MEIVTGQKELLITHEHILKTCTACHEKKMRAYIEFIAHFLTGLPDVRTFWLCENCGNIKEPVWRPLEPPSFGPDTP